MFLGGLVLLPDAAAAKVRAPVVGQEALARLGGLGRAPNVPVALRTVLARAGFLELGVLVRGVVDDEVEHNAHAAGIRLLNEREHVL